jgi:hypothetical protein
MISYHLSVLLNFKILDILKQILFNFHDYAISLANSCFFVLMLMTLNMEIVAD